MLKDVAYQMRTPDFWNSMDMIGGKASYELGGSFFDGKGQPAQIERGEPRLRAGALPADQRHQHREEGVSRAHIASRDEPKRLLSRASLQPRRCADDARTGAGDRASR